MLHQVQRYFTSELLDTALHVSICLLVYEGRIYYAMELLAIVRTQGFNQ